MKILIRCFYESVFLRVPILVSNGLTNVIFLNLYYEIVGYTGTDFYS